MSKGQKRNNRELKKPKQVKAAAVVATAATLLGPAKTNIPGRGKKRW